MSGCLTCLDPIPPCPASCPAGFCIQETQTCTSCAKRICVAPSSNKGGSSTGATVGGAVGGILAVAVALLLAYFFWWKPKGLAASRRRYSKHLSARQSKLVSPLDIPGDSNRRSLGVTGNGAVRKSSVHLRMDGVPGEGGLSRRNGSPGGLRGNESMPMSVGQTPAIPSNRNSLDVSQ